MYMIERDTDGYVDWMAIGGWVTDRELAHQWDSYALANNKLRWAKGHFDGRMYIVPAVPGGEAA